MRKKTCFIIEDEAPAQEVLKSYIERTEWLELIGVFGDSMEALDALQKREPDMMFLDIEMPGINGFGLLKILKSSPDVIITSAYSEYAVDAFDLEVHDYLMKPFSFERFLKAVSRVSRRVNRSAELLQPPRHNRDERFTFFNVNKKMVKVFFEDIRYVESMRDYVNIHTGSGTVVTRIAISEVEAMLGEKFLRIHRSFLINTDRVSAYSAEAVFIDEQQIPIGTNYKKLVEAAFQRSL